METASNRSDAKANKGKDWRSTCTGLSQQLWYLYRNEICTDVQVIVEALNSIEMFQCHKLVLIRLSDVFLSLIKEADGGIITVKLTTNNAQIFQIILRFAYLEELALKSMKDALGVHKFACDFQVTELVKKCEEFISRNIDMHSVWEVLDYAPNKSAFKMWAKSVLGKEIKGSLASEKFLKCSLPTLQTMVNMHQLNMPSELDLVVAVIKWAKHKNNGMELTPQRSQELLGPVLNKIRFLSLSAAEFSEHVATSGLLDKSDCLAILVNLAAPGQMPVPNQICRETRPREKVSESGARSQEVSTRDAKQQSVVKPSNVEKEAVPKTRRTRTRTRPMKTKVSSLPDITKLTLSTPRSLMERKFIVNRELDHRCPPLRLKSPGEFNLNFQMNRAAIPEAICIQTQDSATNAKSYREALHITVCELGRTSKKILYQTFHGDASYGDELLIPFTARVEEMNPAVWYSVKILLRAPGEYTLQSRPNLVVTEGLKVVFNKEDTCAWKPCIVTKLLFKTTDSTDY